MIACMQENMYTHEITRALDDLRSGTPGASDRLMSLVYEQMRVLARVRAMANDTIQPTEIVHEAWMKLAPGLDRLDNRRHFFGSAARAIRQVIADYARAARRQKRGGGVNTIAFDDSVMDVAKGQVDLVCLHDALEELRRLNPRHADVIELRALGGMTIVETAEFLGVSHSTVDSDWAMARAWLHRRLAAG